MAGKITHTKKELDELRQRLEAERAELQVQLTTIEETSFANSQSDISGEVSFDEENADAGTFTFERERDLSMDLGQLCVQRLLQVAFPGLRLRHAAEDHAMEGRTQPF